MVIFPMLKATVAGIGCVYLQSLKADTPGRTAEASNVRYRLGHGCGEHLDYVSTVYWMTDGMGYGPGAVQYIEKERSSMLAFNSDLLGR